MDSPFTRSLGFLNPTTSVPSVCKPELDLYFFAESGVIHYIYNFQSFHLCENTEERIVLIDKQTQQSFVIYLKTDEISNKSLYMDVQNTDDFDYIIVVSLHQTKLPLFVEYKFSGLCLSIWRNRVNVFKTTNPEIVLLQTKNLMWFY